MFVTSTTHHERRNHVMKRFFKLVVVCLVLVGVFRLGGCSGDRKASNAEAKITDLERQLEEANKTIAIKNEDLNTVAYAISPTYDVPDVPSAAPAESSVTSVTPMPSATQQTVEYMVKATDVSIPQIAADKEKPFATLVYCGQSFKMTTYSEDDRESIKEITFPYYGSSERNGQVVVSGVTINGVYKLAEGSWDAVAGVKFDYVDNTYAFPVRAEGSYTNIYMVQTVNGTHYYFGVNTGNNAK